MFELFYCLAVAFALLANAIAMADYLEYHDASTKFRNPIRKAYLRWMRKEG
ncbi:hypothetical protein [uncultured Paraglaciecola sp.]|uniref:hypothetical protein n=1 Tax=uncultured Paraglaciecola sp. TaxID=1765024 RepID=UPI00262017F4|nr:hypothetical protein [uncultured Paraglaciecola sp.]